MGVKHFHKIQPYTSLIAKMNVSLKYKCWYIGSKPFNCGLIQIVFIIVQDFQPCNYVALRMTVMYSYESQNKTLLWAKLNVSSY
jgi:hypothetical protein